MMVNKDGWVYEVPNSAAFVEFRSSHESGMAGVMLAYDGDGNELELTSLGLVPDAEPWHRRVATA